VLGTATQRVQNASSVSSNNSSSSSGAAVSTVAPFGSGGLRQNLLGATPAVAPLGQPLAQVPRPALAPGHTVQPSLLSQRLVLTSQAQARLPSKWPSILLHVSPFGSLHKPMGSSDHEAFFPGALLMWLSVWASHDILLVLLNLGLGPS